MGSYKTDKQYIHRAQEALKSAQDALQAGHLETATSRAYYACFFAIHSFLAHKKITVSSHKQTAVEFRRLVIKTGDLDKKYSDILTELSDWRMMADYAPLPEIDLGRATHLVQTAEDFVTALLKIS
jgi:uncharacterized protein